MLVRVLKGQLVGVILCTSLLPTGAWAADLISVYRQALVSDPTFKAAEAARLLDQEGVANDRAALLPSLTATANTTANRQGDSSHIGRPPTYNSNGYTITLTQTLFDYNSWYGLKSAHVKAKQAQATYDAAAQDLMLRVAKAYFAVLQAGDNLHFTEARKKATARQYEQAKQRFDVGLVAITDVYDAKAKHDIDMADSIAAQNDLENRREDLREITNESYTSLKTLKRIPLQRPRPAKIDEWVALAEKQNFTLMAARLGVLAARHDVSAAFGGHLPTAKLEAKDVQSSIHAHGNTAATNTNTLSLALKLDLPVYEGGLVSSQVRAAEYTFQQDSANLEKSYRDIVNQTRQAYLGIVAELSQVKALRQAVKSNRSAVEAAWAAFQVGTKTIVDVLDAQTKLFQAQKNYSESRYAYIIDVLTLKQSVGTLSVSDLEIVNQWLHAEAKTKSEEKSPAKISETKHLYRQPVQLPRQALHAVYGALPSPTNIHVPLRGVQQQVEAKKKVAVYAQHKKQPHKKMASATSNVHSAAHKQGRGKKKPAVYVARKVSSHKKLALTKPNVHSTAHNLRHHTPLHRVRASHTFQGKHKLVNQKRHNVTAAKSRVKARSAVKPKTHVHHHTASYVMARVPYRSTLVSIEHVVSPPVKKHH